jgi:hypothetical protein
VRDLDRDTAERMLDGRVAPDDAPPGYGLVARLIAVLRTTEPASGGAQAAPGQAPPRRRGAGRALRAQLVLLALALGTTLMVGLASAGALPGPIQGAAASVLERLGVHVPGTDQGSSAGDGATPAVATPNASASSGSRTVGTRKTPSSGATKAGDVAPTGNAATPATAATPAIQADPGATGDGSTPAVPADPADPAAPTHPTTPTHPATPTSPTTPTQPTRPPTPTDPPLPNGRTVPDDGRVPTS